MQWKLKDIKTYHDHTVSAYVQGQKVCWTKTGIT